MTDTGRIDTEELKLLLHEAAEAGAKAALHSLGLHDETAAEDIHDLRQLLQAWRIMARGSLGLIGKLVTVALLIMLGWVVGLVPVGKLIGGN